MRCLANSTISCLETNLQLQSYAKYRNQRLIYQEKSFVHKKIILNCLANAHGFYNYTLEIQSLRFYDLSPNKRRTTKNIYV